MQRRFTLLFGVLLVSSLPGAAQKPAASPVVPQEYSAPESPRFRQAPTRWSAAAFLKPEAPAKSPIHSILSLTPTDAGDLDLERLFHVQKTETLFVEHWHMPVAQFWGGRLQLDGFQSEIRLDNVVLGPSAAGGLHDFRPARRSQPGMLQGFEVCGIRLGFQFGRDPQSGNRPMRFRPLVRTLRAVIADELK